MANRKRMWCPFRMGVPTSLTAGSIVRVDIMSILESRLARAIEGYTTQRSIFTVSQINTGPAVSQLGVGIINLTESSGLGAVTPIGDPNVDWMFWEEIMTESANNERMLHMKYDVETVRMSKGQDRHTWIILENSGAQPMDVYVAGRMLILD